MNINIWQTCQRYRGWALALLLITSGAMAKADMENLRTQISEGLTSASRVAGEALTQPEQLKSLYASRDYQPLWLDQNHELTPAAQRWWQALFAVKAEGLSATDYHVPALTRLLRQAASRAALVELLLSDAFLSYAHDQLQGRLTPDQVDPDWQNYATSADGLALLRQATASAEQMEAVLMALPPPYSGYADLRLALAQYRMLAAQGGWSKIEPGETLRPGDDNPRIAQIRQRLLASAELSEPDKVADTHLDATLAADISRFQSRHGLRADGTMGPSTLAAMNVSAAQRIWQIRLNMERWRWAPRGLGDRYILVNAGGYELQVVEKAQEVMRMLVIVGAPNRPTPVFKASMRYLVLNPTWTVPRSLAVEDVLPKIRRNPGYLKQHNIHVLTSHEGTWQEVDPQTINWAKLNKDNFPYYLREEAGPLNPLGKIKFMFPNAYDVYLHDTPAHQLFDSPTRGFSAGCIRVQDALGLAEYLLRNSGWDRQKLQTTLATGKTTTINLPKAMPIYIGYWTAWVAPDGSIQFRQDPYGRDLRLARALRDRHAPNTTTHQ